MSDRALGAACVLAWVARAAAARDYSAAFSYEPLGPRAFPMLLAVGLGLCGLWMLWRPTLGAQAFKGKINQEIEQTFSVPGLYGIQCIPHLAMGMVMLIQVGAPAAEAPEVPAALPKRAVDRFNALLQREAAQ